MNSWTPFCSDVPKLFPCQCLCFPSAVPTKLQLFIPKVVKSPLSAVHSCLPGPFLPRCYLGSFFTFACATSGTFVQSAVIQSGLKISGKSPTGLYDLWGSACLHPALESTSSTWYICSNLQPWLCLSVPYAATDREIAGGSIASIKMSDS